jgi:hypothetical protein
MDNDFFRSAAKGVWKILFEPEFEDVYPSPLNDRYNNGEPLRVFSRRTIVTIVSVNHETRRFYLSGPQMKRLIKYLIEHGEAQ